MAAPLMQMGVLVTPYINQQGFNAMAKSQGANFAAQFQQGMSRASQPLGRITGQVSEFEKSMAAANARVLAFGASAGSIYLVKDAFEKMISSTIEVEKSLASINTILQLGQTQLKNFSSEMFKAASATGQTFQTASQVALEFARHGVSATETTKRMTSAMQLMRISGLDAQESVNAITAAINAFNKEGLSSEDIINRLTAVDTKFAVSAQDLAKAIERVGSTATEAGVKFNQLLGLVTAVQTATARGGAVIGNAFKSIFTRLARPEVLSDLEAIGITTRNAQGQILPMIDLLKRLASQYNTLNYAQKSFVTEAVGGVYQVNILKASLADLGKGFSIYDKAALAASQSTGLIEQRMASLNETIASKLNTTVLQFTRLSASFGQTAFGSGVKSGLDSLNEQIENIGNQLDEVADNSSFGEKISHSLTQGIAKGLGDIVSGPGVQIAAALVAKIAKGFGKFAYQSSRDFMGLNEPLKEQAAVQQSIAGFLQQNVTLVNQWVKGQINLNTLVGIYLQSMKNANILQNQMANAVGGATAIAGPSIRVGMAAGSRFVPNFSIDPSEPYHVWDTRGQGIIKRGTYENKASIDRSAELRNKKYGAYRYVGKLGSEIELMTYAGMANNPNASMVVGNKTLQGQEILDWFFEKEAIRKALQREGSSTAEVGFSSTVVSPANPLGALVYDKAYQKSPDDAFRQHIAIGQTDLKNMGGGKGGASFVPNFGIGESLALGALQGTFNNLNGFLSPLAYHYNRQLELIRKMNEQYSALTSQIRAGTEIKYNGNTYNNKTPQGGVDIKQNLRDFLLDFRQANPNFVHSPQGQGKQNTAYEAYRSDVQKTQARLSTYATYGMVGAPLLAETGASFAKNFGKLDLSKGLEEFSSGIVEAGQLLSTFPNKLGVMLASSEVIKSLSDSVAVFASGFGKYEHLYDLASTKAEKMASAGNSVLESFERLKNAATDATVTLDEYQALQEKYAKSLTELGAIQPNAEGRGGGADVVRKLASATTADEKQRIISQAIDAQNQQKGELGIRMQLAQLTSQGSVGFYNYAKNRAGGIFGATSETDALTKQQLLAATAVQMEQGALNSENLPKGFADRMKRAALTSEDVAAMTKEASKSSILEGLDKNSIAEVMKQFTYEIEKFKMPPGVSSDEWQSHLDRLNELTAQEASIRLKYNQELQNVLQKGAILSNFALTTGAGNIESTYRQRTFATFVQGKGNDLASLTSSEIPMIARRTQVRAQEIQDQVSRDIAQNQNKGAKEISSAVAKAATESVTLGLQMTGQKGDVAALGPQRVQANAFLATRQQLFAQSPAALINAAKNPETFGSIFLGDRANAAKNGITSSMYDTIANKLSAAVNGQQENITNILEETKQINEKGLNDLAQLSIEQIAAIKEARFQELAQGIKGIDELARGGARKARRELRRDEYTVEHSRNAIRRGEAARDLLNFIPSDERDYNNPQIRNLYNTAQAGSRSAFNYIFRGSGLQGFAESDERSFARTFGNFKGVNTPTIGLSGGGFGVGAAAGIDVSGLTLAVHSANNDITSFGKSLEDIGASLVDFKKALQDINDAKTAEGNKFGANGTSQSAASPNVPISSAFMDNVKQYGLPALNALIQLGFIAAALRRGGGGGAATQAAGAGGGALASSTASKLASFLGIGSKATTAVSSGVTAGMNAANEAKAVTTATQAAANVAEKVEQAVQKPFQQEFSFRNSKGQFYMGGRPKVEPVVHDVSPEREFDRVANAIKKGEKVSITRGGEAVTGLSNLKGKNIGQIKNVLSGLGYTPEYIASTRGAGAAASAVAAAAPSAASAEQQLEFVLNSANKVAPSAAPAVSRFAGLSRFAGIGGKFLKGAGFLGAGLSAYGAYNQVRSGDYSGALVNAGTTALSFAGPIGLAGALGVNAIQAEANKLQGYHTQIAEGTGQGIGLDNKLAFINKYGKQYKAAINKGINATDDDKALMATYERVTGATSLKTKTAVIQKQATDFFNEKKDVIEKNLIHPVGTYESKGYVYGYTGHGARSIIGKASDSNKADEIKAYTEREEAKRNAEIASLSRSKQGLAYLAAQDQRAAAFAGDLTNKKFLPDQATTEKANTPAEQQKPQTVDVKVAAEPATVEVKLLGNDGTVLQTILTKLAFMETQLNTLQGTPKPASVNHAVSQ